MVVNGPAEVDGAAAAGVDGTAVEDAAAMTKVEPQTISASYSVSKVHPLPHDAPPSYSAAFDYSAAPDQTSYGQRMYNNQEKIEEDVH